MDGSAKHQRWLILTSSTGSGHDTRAYALCDWARARLGDRVEVEVWHVLEETSLVGRFGVWLYNLIQRWMPGLHQLYWHIAELWSWLNERIFAFGGGALRRELERRRPDLIISMHDSLNAPYFKAARTVLGRERIRCATYCGEWSAGYGFSRHWIDPTVDFFIARTPGVEVEAEGRGVPPARVFVFRNLLRPVDYDPALDGAERDAFRTEELGLEANRFTVMLATGALGADRHYRLLDQLLPLASRLQVIALCGRNVRAMARLERWSQAHPALRLSVQRYTADMARLFQATDVVVTRGGSNTLAECLHHGCPPLFHAAGGIMPQECCTRRFLRDQKIGLAVRSPAHLREVLEHLLDRPTLLAEMRRRMDELRDHEHPHTLVDRLFKLGREVVP